MRLRRRKWRQQRLLPRLLLLLLVVTVVLVLGAAQEEMEEEAGVLSSTIVAIKDGMEDLHESVCCFRLDLGWVDGSWSNRMTKPVLFKSILCPYYYRCKRRGLM